MTINTIAQLSGLSKKTISRVINNEPNVKEETREKVLALIKEHNYRPNVYARNMSRKINKNILISVCLEPNFNNTRWIQQLLNRLSSNSAEYKYRVLVETFYGDFVAENSAMFEGGMVDCVVLLYEKEGDPRVEYARRSDIPCISFGRSISGISYIANANVKATGDVFRFLIGRNLDRISFILGNHIGTNVDRAESALNVYRELGIHDNKLRTIWEVNSIEEIIELVNTDIEQNRLPDVYVVSGDEKALGVYRAIEQNNMKIPADVSVMGFDNIPISKYLNPPLSTVAQDFDALSVNLLESIRKLMEDPGADIQIEIPMELIVRESTR